MMDSLPKPALPCHQILIPYLVKEQINVDDDFDFGQFPSRKNWTVSQLIDVLNADHTTHKDGKTFDDALAFIQAWLYFGTLREVFGTNGVPINMDDYISETTEAPGLVITSKKLPIHVGEYLSIENSLPVEKRMQNHRAVMSHLELVASLAVRFEQACPPDATVPSSIFFSVVVLCTSLASLLYNSDFTFSGAPGREFLSSLMLRAGWCPNQVAMTGDMFTEASRYYIYLLGPHRSGKDHSACTREDCALNQVDEETYETKHVSAGCVCGWVKPDIGKIVAIADRGSIPLVALSLSGPLDCRVEEFKPGMRYVAISHVWADGLGNPRDNCLPVCQMEKLRDRARNLIASSSLDPDNENRIYLWMDTLCIPLSPPTAKKAAILTMRKTYAEATCVLVLDADIMALALPQTALEARFRIVTASWYSRLWTYQECILAKSLHFQFRDGVLTGEELYLDEKASEDEKARHGRASVHHLVRSWPRSVTLGNLIITGETQEGRGQLLQGLRWKSTTKIRDEPICMAALLNLDMSQLMAAPEDERFKAMLSLQHTFWLGMLFYSGPRLEEYHYRWAPASFMSKGDPIPLGFIPAWFTWHSWGFAGLTFQSIGYSFSFAPARMPTNVKELTFFIPHTEGIVRADCNNTSCSNFWPELAKENLPLTIAIIPGNAIPLSPEESPPVVGAVCVILKQENLIFARFICLVQIKRTECCDVAEATGAAETNILDMGTADIVPYQWWCIG